MLGLVDFGLAEEELKEIHPWLSHRIESAVSHLIPVLAPARALGGVRIYHESFRRFINERLRERGGSAVDVLAPVIDWLKRRDFFGDARAYRFLLPTLRRAGRHAELLEMVGTDFVSRSVEAGHSQAAVEQNLSLATYVAAEDLAWAALARCVELHKSCTVCFRDKLTGYDLYGRAFAAVHGAAALAERMLFDGRPTFPANQGLIFCSLCDDAGVVPPWEQYLSLARKKSDDEDGSRDPNWQDYAIAKVHGMIRLEGAEAIYGRVVVWLGRVFLIHHSSIYVALLDGWPYPAAWIFLGNCFERQERHRRSRVSSRSSWQIHSPRKAGRLKRLRLLQRSSRRALPQHWPSNALRLALTGPRSPSGARASTAREPVRTKSVTIPKPRT